VISLGLKLEAALVKAIAVIEKSSGDKSQRELIFAVSPRIGETILVPSLGLTPGFKALVSEIFHQPATRDDPAELYLVLQLKED
jgi:hypothetical protein